MSDALKEQISTLEALQKRLGGVRQVPPQLVQMGSTGAAFGAVRTIGEAVLSEPVQAALARARESLETDGPGRRVNRKRRRAATPEEYVQERAVPPRRPEEPVPLEELGAWATRWNASQATARLRIRGKVVRVVLADVLTAYLGIGVGADGAVVVETVKIFGAREAGHGESAFAVFQQVGQQLGRGLAGGGAGLAAVAGHVLAYGDLFVGPCAVCGRVVSAEGHVPCVVRRWAGAGWVAEHAGCGRV